MNSLSDYWSDFFDYCTKPPYIHRDDLPFFHERYSKGKPDAWERLDFKGFIRSERLCANDSDFHFSLLPAPYVGNLAKADVFILLLNPGFSPGDYFAEYEQTDFKKALKQNLKQEFLGVEYPFLYLDPQFCWHPGYRWWEGKLRKIVQAVAEKRDIRNYPLALRAVSRRIASIEVVPYHSRRFGDGKLLTKLGSALSARAWVSGYLIPRALEGKLVVVATHKWHLKNRHNSVVCLGRFQARAASLAPKTEAGKLVLAQLLKEKP